MVRVFFWKSKKIIAVLIRLMKVTLEFDSPVLSTGSRSVIGHIYGKTVNLKILKGFKKFNGWNSVDTDSSADFEVLIPTKLSTIKKWNSKRRTIARNIVCFWKCEKTSEPLKMKEIFWYLFCSVIDGLLK